VRGDPLRVDQKLVALRFAAKDGEIVDDERASTMYLEEDCGGESADSVPTATRS
jgi:hypothetical protein